jgi:hypothetical protein
MDRELRDPAFPSGDDGEYSDIKGELVSNLKNPAALENVIVMST